MVYFEIEQNLVVFILDPVTSNTLLVLYLYSEPEGKVIKDTFSVVHTFIATQKYHHMILITQNGLGSTQKEFIQHRTAGYHIEEFLDKQLAIDPLKHALSPITIKYIRAEEANEWAREEQLQPHQLPMMLTNDAIGKRYGASPYDIFQTEIIGFSVRQLDMLELLDKNQKKRNVNFHRFGWKLNFSLRSKKMGTITD